VEWDQRSRPQHDFQLGLGVGRGKGRQVAGGHKNMVCHKQVSRVESHKKSLADI